jgi:ATP-dependent RNA helicase RhlE
LHHRTAYSACGWNRLNTERSVLTSFQDFGLADPIERALKEENYVTPTPIQAQTIPVALTGKDVVGIAQTGTGKTAAFALPILHRLIHPRKQVAPKSCRVLVLSPTRELSGQILDSFEAYGRHLRLKTALAIGGVPMGRQVRSILGGVDVLVATPGRLLDLIGGNALKLGQVEFLVLDEADRMLDMGFINDIRKIVAKVPTERQTLFFSATMPKDIAELAERMLRDPAHVAVTPAASTAERVTQRIIEVDRGVKPALLAEILKNETVDRALVFTRTKHGADKVVKSLAKAEIPAEAIHGNKSQNHRERVLAAFRNGSIRTLVATDIAARGIDVDGISHVINFDMPNIPESYVHRIGRTARAGADGIAISFVDADETAYLKDIERLIRQTLPRENRRTSNGGGAPAERPAGTRSPQQRSRDGRRGPGHGQRPQGGRDAQAEPARGHHAKGNRHSPAHGAGQGQGHQGNGAEQGHHGQRRPNRDSAAQPQRAHGNAQPSRAHGHSAGAQEGMQGVGFMKQNTQRPAANGGQGQRFRSDGRSKAGRGPQR